MAILKPTVFPSPFFYLPPFPIFLLNTEYSLAVAHVWTLQSSLKRLVEFLKWLLICLNKVHRQAHINDSYLMQEASVWFSPRVSTGMGMPGWAQRQQGRAQSRPPRDTQIFHAALPSLAPQLKMFNIKKTTPNFFVVLHPAFNTGGSCNSSFIPKVGLSSENSNLTGDGEKAAQPGLGKIKRCNTGAPVHAQNQLSSRMGKAH